MDIHTRMLELSKEHHWHSLQGCSCGDRSSTSATAHYQHLYKIADDERAIEYVESRVESVIQIILKSGYTLEDADNPNDVREWAADEAKAYRDNGGFSEGREAVYLVRARKIAEQMVEKRIIHAP